MRVDRFGTGRSQCGTTGIVGGVLQSKSFQRLITRSGGVVSGEVLYSSLSGLIAPDGIPRYQATVRASNLVRALMLEMGVRSEVAVGDRCLLTVRKFVIQENEINDLRGMLPANKDPKIVVPDWFNELHLRVFVSPLGRDGKRSNRWHGMAIFDSHGNFHQGGFSFIESHTGENVSHSYELDETLLFPFLTILARMAVPGLLPPSGLQLD